MFVLVFTVEGRQPAVATVEDEAEATRMFKRHTPRGSKENHAVIEIRSPTNTPGFIWFSEADLISVEIYEELDPKEEERRAHDTLVSTVESHRRLSRSS